MSSSDDADDPVFLDPRETLTIAFLADLLIFGVSLAVDLQVSDLGVAALAMANVVALGYVAFDYIGAIAAEADR